MRRLIAETYDVASPLARLNATRTDQIPPVFYARLTLLERRAVLKVEAVHSLVGGEHENTSPRHKDFSGRLAVMYTRWADSRGMRIDRLEAPADEHLFAVTGLGSGEILMPENGLHVMEIDRERRDGEHNTERVSAVAQVASWAPGLERNRGALAEVARSALEETSVAPTVVRRYRLEPAPLVRDARRGYRTGRLDRVLAGDFDLF